jgi:branched-chain amino acid transport system substrate-binding protein
VKIRFFALCLVSLSAGLASMGAMAAPSSVSSATAHTRATVSCKSSATIGYMGPTTGPVASIGEELRIWSLFYIAQWNATHKFKIHITEGDDAFDPAQASTIATQFASNSKILGVLGPGSSPEVVAASPAFIRAGVPFIAATATRTTLTDGSIPTFFRIAPPDSVQAKTTTDYMVKKLKVKRVAIFDDQSAYSAPLAASVAQQLAQRGVKVYHSSVSQKQSDFSSSITNIPSGTQLVYLPFTVPANMQLFGEQMVEQGKRIPLFVGDAGYSTDFHINGSDFSTFAPDIRTIPADRGVLKAFFKKYGAKAPLTTYGPPAYTASEAMVQAIARACAKGSATRASVFRQLHKTKLKTSILGHPIRFTAHGDVVGAHFVIFQIRNGHPVVIQP